MESLLLRQTNGTETTLPAVSRAVAVSVTAVPRSTARGPPSIVILAILIGGFAGGVTPPEQPATALIVPTTAVTATTRAPRTRQVARQQCHLDRIT